MIKIYLRKHLKYDIDNDRKEEDITAFVLANTIVFKLRKMPPKRNILDWRKKKIKHGVSANIAILRDGKTVLTSLWYDLNHLKDIAPATREILKELLEAIPEDKRTKTHKKTLKKFERMKLGGENMIRITELSEAKKEFWHNILPLGEFYDPRYGKIQITKELIQQLAENFKKGIPHYKPPVNISHNDLVGKYGDIVDVEAREDGLWAKIVLTDEGAELVQKKKFEYLSAEFTEHYTDKETGEDVGAVLVGVALTNRPAHPKMQPIKLSEKLYELYSYLADIVKYAFQAGMSTKAIMDDEDAEVKLMVPKVVNTPKDDSPRWDWDWAKDGNAIIEKLGWRGLAEACAYVDKENYELDPEDGLPHNKQAYKLPHHKLIDGKLTLVWGGVSAAMKALLGARGGADIPVKDRKRVYNHLAAHYKAFDKEPPEFHLEEEVDKQMEDKVIALEEQLKALEEEKTELVKKLEEANQKVVELEEQLKAKEREAWEAKVENWAKDWLNKGVKPAVIEKAKKIVLEQPEQMKVFEEIFEDIKQPELTTQLSEEVDNKQILESKVKNAVKMIMGEKE